MINIIDQIWREASILTKITLAVIIIGFLSILIAGISSDVYLADEAFHYRLARYTYQEEGRPLYDPLLHTNEVSGKNYYVNEPLWHTLLALSWGFTGGPSQTSAQLFQALTYLFLVFSVYLLAKELFGQECACYSALLAATTPFVISYSVILHPDHLAAALCAMCLFMVLKGRFVWAAIILGLTFWTKRNAYFIAPAMVLCVFYYTEGLIRQRLVNTLLFITVFMAVALPDIHYRYTHFGLVSQSRLPDEITPASRGRVINAEERKGFLDRPQAGSGRQSGGAPPATSGGNTPIIPETVKEPIVKMPDKPARKLDIKLFAGLRPAVNSLIQPVDKTYESRHAEEAAWEWVHPECIINHPNIIPIYLGGVFIVTLALAILHWLKQKRFLEFNKRYAIAYFTIPTYLLFFFFCFYNNWGLRYLGPIFPLFFAFGGSGFVLLQDSSSRYARYILYALILLCALQAVFVSYYVFQHRKMPGGLKEAYAYAKENFTPSYRTLCPKGSFALYTERPVIWRSLVAPIELDYIFWKADERGMREALGKFNIRYLFIDKDRIYDDTGVHHHLGYPRSFVERLRTVSYAKLLYNNDAVSIWEIAETFKSQAYYYRALRLAPVFADFNGDGRSDMGIFDNPPEADGHIQVALSNGSELTPLTPWIKTSFPGDSEIPMAGDFNGDGKADVLLYNTTGGLSTYLSNGKTFLKTEPQPAQQIGPEDYLLTGDFNSDNKTDICVYNQAGSAHVYLSKGDGFTDTKAWIEGSPAEGYAPVTGDFNGDKKCDLCTIPRDGLFAVYLSNGDGFEKPSLWLRDYWARPGETLVSGDFNGDGKTDVCLCTMEGYLEMFFSTGSGFTRSGPWLGDFHIASGELITSGDFNGDKASDLVVISPNNKIEVFNSTKECFLASNVWFQPPYH